MEKTIRTTDGLSLWSEAFGQPGDRPILLIMGAMNQGIFWPDAFCRRLASLGYYVIRYDHRDTGQSSTVDFQTQPYRLAELTQDALAVLHGHQLPKATVVGLSMGGYIAQLLAIEHPEAVDRLVLISSSADQRPYMAATMGQPAVDFALPGPGAALLDYIRATLAQPPESAAAIEQNVLTGWALTYGGRREFPRAQVTAALHRAAGRTSNPLAAVHHALAVAASPDRLKGIQSIAAPTLVIHGRADSLLPLAHGEYLARHIPGARLQLFDMGHSFMWSWDDEVLASLAAFLADHSIAPPFQTNHD
ncbi:alpha/beta fold hydrolase [Dechloromonas denitrificans]|uniref:alpha/beta fold hydrolase n=1 Tax=Dechloromonas denitrificans TaxID=281362 RepID=UPI001CFAEDE0|nr:alpha/beta fold hydrolase [Dechloromonas denitrificans]UCV06472.1 alpha/beta hydrolase [Dechloromonas denitrificans]